MGGQERQLKKGQKQAIWWICQFNCVFEVYSFGVRRSTLKAWAGDGIEVK